MNKDIADIYIDSLQRSISKPFIIVDHGVPGGDNTCIMYGERRKDGKLRVTKVEFYEPEDYKRGFWEASWLSVRDRCSRIAHRILTVANEKRLH